MKGWTALRGGGVDHQEKLDNLCGLDWGRFWAPGPMVDTPVLNNEMIRVVICLQDTVWVSCKHAAVATTDADRQVGGTSSTCLLRLG